VGNYNHTSILHGYEDMELQFFGGSRDRWTRNIWFPISDTLKPPLYLAQLLRYCVSNI